MLSIQRVGLARHDRVYAFASRVHVYQEVDYEDDCFITVRNESESSIAQVRVWQVIRSNHHSGKLCLTVDGPVSLRPDREVQYILRGWMGNETAVSFSDQAGFSWLRWVQLPPPAGLQSIWLDESNEELLLLSRPRTEGQRFSLIRRNVPDDQRMPFVDWTEVDPEDRLPQALRTGPGEEPWILRNSN